MVLLMLSQLPFPLKVFARFYGKTQQVLAFEET